MNGKNYGKNDSFQKLEANDKFNRNFKKLGWQSDA